MKASARIVGVAASVAGDVAVSEEELAKKLGRAAWLVWQILCARRDSKGETHVSGKGIMHAKGFASVSRSAMHEALRRLEKAGLVERIGYQARSVPCGKSFRTRDVYVRRVRGARALHLVGTDPRVLVPAITKAWMGSAATWGGKRSGAGRPSDHERRLRSLAIQGESGDRVIKTRPRVGNMYMGDKKGLTELRSPSESESCPAEAGSPSSVSEHTTELGTVIAGGATKRGLILGNAIEGLPPYPGQSVVSPAYEPNPPKLPADAKAPELVAFLMAAYRGALEAYYDIRLPRKKTATVKKKDRDVLLRAAAELAAHDIAPAIWCWYRIERYAQAKLPPGSKRPAHPPIAYVFSESALTEKRWQFRAVWGDGLIGGRAVFGKKLIELLGTYRRMVAEVNRGMSKAEALETFFPGNRYNDMVDAAKIEAVETHNKISMRVQRGEFVWRP